MSSSEPDNHNESAPVEVNEDLILDLNFVPQWARKPPDTNYFEDREFRNHDRKRDRGNRGRPHRDSGDRDQRRGSRPMDRRDRRPPRRERDDQRRRPDRAPRPESGGMPPPPSTYSATADRRDPRPDRDRRPPMRHDRRFEMPPVVISILPKPKGLSLIVHKIHMAKRAFPVTELASLFLSNPDFCDIKLESRRGEPRVTIYQCAKCRTVSLNRPALESHIIRAHFDEFFLTEETETEAPTGQFVCVARCGLSGTLLGPPNHHSYAEKVREVHQALYPHMNVEDYRQRIETVRDPELIEKWKEESRKQTVYRLKEADQPGETMTWTEAETYFHKTQLPQIVKETHRAVLPAEVAVKMEDRQLHQAIGEIWRRESRRPRSLLYALRAAFRHMHLHSFQAGKQTFLCAVEPTPMDASHAVDSIRAVLAFLEQHPGCTRKDLMEALRPGAAPDSPEAADILTPLSWLVEKGHIIEFFNGTFSVPRNGEAPDSKADAAVTVHSASPASE